MKAIKQMGRHIRRRDFHDGSRHIALGMIHILVLLVLSALLVLTILSILCPRLAVLLPGNIHLLTMMMVMDVHGYQCHEDSHAEHDYGQSFLHLIIYMSH